MSRVFISYAREDKRVAERLYMDLRKASINVWLDSKSLRPGQDWKFEINKAIRESSYFIALISSQSLNKRGYVQRELKEALDILLEFPKSQIFLIPVKLDETTPEDKELRNLNWVNLFESYSIGVEKILSVISSIDKAPLEVSNRENSRTLRPPIEFIPFSSFEEYIKEFFRMLPEAAMFFNAEHLFYIVFDTTHTNLQIAEFLKEKHPQKMTIVLQHQWKDLKVYEDYFEVLLWFDKKRENLRIPYQAIEEIFSPTIDLRIGRM